MADVVRLPIRAGASFDREGEIHVGRVGMVDILVARIITTIGPETWGVIVRSPGEPDTMPVSLQDLGNPEGFGVAVGNLAATVEATLKAARARAAALCADEQGEST